MIWAKVTLRKEGFHYWKNAYEEVDFLKNKHRHVFQIVVMVEQRHNERDIEYIMFKHLLEKSISEINGPESCETIATNIMELVQKVYPGRRVRVEVTEDGENGAIVDEQ